MTWVLAIACGLASVPAGLRWLRVAQREHYLAPSVTRFAFRWWTNGWANLFLVAVAVVGLIGVLVDTRFGFLVAAAQIGPLGLPLRGRSSALAWTQRLRRLAGVVGFALIVVYLSGGFFGEPVVVVLGLFLLPVLFDLGLWLMAPVERSLGNRWVRMAATRLAQSGARVVAITGSYGKTTTKQYVDHLISGSVRTVASPASFNNRMGLARAINEQLVEGTDVFIAEMGTYGPGEIAELCEWVRPDVAAIVAIGPVHLERFRTEENIVRAKAEILDGAEIGVIAIDHPLLADLVEKRATTLEIVTVSGQGGDASVKVDPINRSLTVDGDKIGQVPDDVFATNLAVAVGIASALDIDVDDSRFATLPRAEHRQTVTVSDLGFSIIDDTFNSNPTGAAAGLKKLIDIAPEGRKVLVTPGMVELGPLQDSENEALARQAAQICDDMLIVGYTNRKSLSRGSVKGEASVTVVANREEAVEWVRSNLSTGDAVLYENDLPDHYP